MQNNHLTPTKTTINHSAAYRIRPITDQAEFNALKSDLTQLIEPYKNQLMDDFTAPTTGDLLSNLSGAIPYLWVGVNQHSSIVTAASLDQIIPGKEAYLHGVRAEGSRHQPIVLATAFTAMHTAFETLNINKLKIEYYSHNRAVKGFCWQFGFTKEAHFSNDSTVNDQPVDVLVYSLTRAQYCSQTKRKLTDVLRQKEKFIQTSARTSAAPYHQRSV